jgi:AmmeMemoRadiSam system protein B
MCLACRGLGASRGELVRYATSGDVTGDRDQVVGYAAVAVM